MTALRRWDWIWNPRALSCLISTMSDKDVLVIADAEQLKRVINNIISNSVKYMDKSRGFIHIRVKDVGDFIQVEIEDNGRGIATKDLPNIFDRFYRTDASRNSSQGGSGIGLSIVRKDHRRPWREDLGQQQIRGWHGDVFCIKKISGGTDRMSKNSDHRR